MSGSGTGTLIYELDNPLIQIKEDRALFNKVIESHVDFLLRPYQLCATVHEARLNEAHHYWVCDINRIGQNDFAGGVPDHFKQAGHLCYWVRRTRPVTDIEVIVKSTKTDLSPNDAYKEEYDLFFNYINEYLGLDLGFHTVLFYHLYDKKNPRHASRGMLPSWDFIECTSHFMNSKNVSPHALFLIYKALFDHLRT